MTFLTNSFITTVLVPLKYGIFILALLGMIGVVSKPFIGDSVYYFTTNIQMTYFLPLVFVSLLVEKIVNKSEEMRSKQ